jgi:hypothetical protein
MPTRSSQINHAGPIGGKGRNVLNSRMIAYHNCTGMTRLRNLHVRTRVPQTTYPGILGDNSLLQDLHMADHLAAIRLGS